MKLLLCYGSLIENDNAKEREMLYSVGYRDASSNLCLYLIVIVYLVCSDYLVSVRKKKKKPTKP